MASSDDSRDTSPDGTTTDHLWGIKEAYSRAGGESKPPSVDEVLRDFLGDKLDTLTIEHLKKKQKLLEEQRKLLDDTVKSSDSVTSHKHKHKKHKSKSKKKKKKKTKDSDEKSHRKKNGNGDNSSDSDSDNSYEASTRKSKSENSIKRTQNPETDSESDSGVRASFKSKSDAKLRDRSKSRDVSESRQLKYSSNSATNISSSKKRKDNDVADEKIFKKKELDNSYSKIKHDRSESLSPERIDEKKKIRYVDMRSDQPIVTKSSSKGSVESIKDSQKSIKEEDDYIENTKKHKSKKRKRSRSRSSEYDADKKKDSKDYEEKDSRRSERKKEEEYYSRKRDREKSDSVSDEYEKSNGSKRDKKKYSEKQRKDDLDRSSEEPNKGVEYRDKSPLKSKSIEKYKSKNASDRHDRESESSDDNIERNVRSDDGRSSKRDKYDDKYYNDNRDRTSRSDKRNTDKSSDRSAKISDKYYDEIIKLNTCDNSVKSSSNDKHYDKSDKRKSNDRSYDKSTERSSSERDKSTEQLSRRERTSSDRSSRRATDSRTDKSERQGKSSRPGDAIRNKMLLSSRLTDPESDDSDCIVQEGVDAVRSSSKNTNRGPDGNSAEAENNKSSDLKSKSYRGRTGTRKDNDDVIMIDDDFSTPKDLEVPEDCDRLSKRLANVIQRGQKLKDQQVNLKAASMTESTMDLFPASLDSIPLPLSDIPLPGACDIPLPGDMLPPPLPSLSEDIARVPSPIPPPIPPPILLLSTTPQATETTFSIQVPQSSAVQEVSLNSAETRMHTEDQVDSSVAILRTADEFHNATVAVDGQNIADHEVNDSSVPAFSDSIAPTDDSASAMTSVNTMFPSRLPMKPGLLAGAKKAPLKFGLKISDSSAAIILSGNKGAGGFGVFNKPQANSEETEKLKDSSEKMMESDDNASFVKGDDKKDSAEKNAEEEEESKSQEEGCRESRSESREKSRRDKSKERKRSKSRDRKRSRSRDRKRSKSRDRHRSKSRERRRSKSRDRKRSRSRDRRRSKSKDRKRSRSRDRKRSSSRTRSSRNKKRSRSRSKSRNRSSSRKRDRKRDRSTSRRRRSRSRSNRRRRSNSRERRRDRRRSRDRSRSRSSRRTENKKKEEEEDIYKIDKAKLREIAIKNVFGNLQTTSSTYQVRPEDIILPPPKKEKPVGKSVEELTNFCKRIVEKGDNSMNEGYSRSAAVADDDDDDDDGGDYSLQNVLRKVREVSSAGFVFQAPTIHQIAAAASGVKKEALTTMFPVSSGSDHQKKEVEALANLGSDEFDDRVFKEMNRDPMEISKFVSERADALRILAVNPNDPAALATMQSLHQKMQEWMAAKQRPGVFTGSTNVQILSQRQLGNVDPRNQAWTKKDAFLRAKPVTGGIGKALLQKMGWREGEGLGKDKDGIRNPIAVDIKFDRKGLTSIDETKNKQNQVYMQQLQMQMNNLGQMLGGAMAAQIRSGVLGGKAPLLGPGSVAKVPVLSPGARAPLLGPGSMPVGASAIIGEPQGKHPVSALSELCTKRRWDSPIFLLTMDGTPASNRLYKFKVVLNGVEYEPPNGCTTKKQAKCDAAAACLQAFGLLC